MISTTEYLHFVDKTFDAMISIVRELGDELVNARPELPGANSPYVILAHCLGVMEFWGGHVVSGRENHRDRQAEFRAAGGVAELLAQHLGQLELTRDVLRGART